MMWLCISIAIELIDKSTEKKNWDLNFSILLCTLALDARKLLVMYGRTSSNLPQMKSNTTEFQELVATIIVAREKNRTMRSKKKNDDKELLKERNKRMKTVNNKRSR